MSTFTQHRLREYREAEEQQQRSARWHGDDRAMQALGGLLIALLAVFVALGVWIFW